MRESIRITGIFTPHQVLPIRYVFRPPPTSDQKGFTKISICSFIVRKPFKKNSDENIQNFM